MGVHEVGRVRLIRPVERHELPAVDILHLVHAGEADGRGLGVAEASRGAGRQAGRRTGARSAVAPPKRALGPPRLKQQETAPEQGSGLTSILDSTAVLSIVLAHDLHTSERAATAAKEVRMLAKVG